MIPHKRKVLAQVEWNFIGRCRSHLFSYGLQSILVKKPTNALVVHVSNTLGRNN